MPCDIWRGGEGKILDFLSILNIDSKKLRQLAKSGHLFLRDQNIQPPLLSFPFDLEPHPNFIKCPHAPRTNNDGWDSNPKPFFIDNA